MQLSSNEVALAGTKSIDHSPKKATNKASTMGLWGERVQDAADHKDAKVAAQAIDWQRRQIFRPRKGPMGPAQRGQPVQRLRWLPTLWRSLRLELTAESEEANLTIRIHPRQNDFSVAWISSLKELHEGAADTTLVDLIRLNDLER